MPQAAGMRREGADRSVGQSCKGGNRGGRKNEPEPDARQRLYVSLFQDWRLISSIPGKGPNRQLVRSGLKPRQKEVVFSLRGPEDPKEVGGFRRWFACHVIVDSVLAIGRAGDLLEDPASYRITPRAPSRAVCEE